MLPISNGIPVDPRQIRCVAFDAVGTLIHPSPPAAEAYHRFAVKFGSNLPAEEIARRFRAAFRATERGDIDGDDFSRAPRLATSEEIEFQRWKRIVTEVIDDIADCEGCFADLFRHFSLPESWGCFSDVAETLERLRRGGIRIALASNFDGRLHAVSDGISELRDVTCRVISSEVGYRKPSPQFFEAMLSRLNCRSDELLMVGDDRENDSEGAAVAGIPAVLINRKSPPAVDEIATLLDLPRWLGL
jgi:putative hydrolase of the HAD superfamily